MLGVVAVALLVVVGAAFALPLYFRGPRLGRLIERLAPPLCGRVVVAGGRLDATVVFDLLFGWPTRMVIEGAALHGPSGDVVVGAQTIETRLRLGLRERSLEIEHLAIARPVFRFERARGRSSLEQALASAPSREQAGRCEIVAAGSNGGRTGSKAAHGAKDAVGRGRPDPSPKRAGTLSLQNVSVRATDVRLSDASLTLDLSDWGLRLDSATAAGTASFTLGSDGVPRLRFDVRRIDATKGGTLRVGPVRRPWAATVPFEHVRIDRVAIDDAAPGTLLLDLGGADTGRSRLAGRARFENVFGWQQRGARDWMAIDARWTQVGDGFSAIRAAWSSALSFLDLSDLDLEAKVNGPYMSPSANLRVHGARLDVTAHVDPDLEAGVQAQFDALDVRPFLPRSLVPALGGKLTGHLEASGAPGTTLGQARATLDELDLRLARSRPGPFPAELRLRKHGEPSTSGPDLADVIVGLVALEDGVLRVGGVRGRIYGGEVDGALSVALLDPRGSPQRAPRMIEPGFDGRLRVRGLDLGLATPKRVATGLVDLGLRVHGPGDELAIGLAFGGDRRLAILGETLVLPATAAAHVLDGERLEVPRLTIARLAGGALHAEGAVVADGDLRATLGIEHWPLGGLPGVRRSRVPLGGELNAALRLSGATASPLLEGEVALDDVRLGRTRFGSGGITLRRLPDGGASSATKALTSKARTHGPPPRFAFAGRLVDRVTIAGQASLGRAPSAEATVAVHGLAVDVGTLPGITLPASLHALRATVSASGHVTASPRTVEFSGHLDALELAAAPRSGRPFVVTTNRPTPVTIAPSGAALGPLTMSAPGIDLVIDGHGGPEHFSAQASGNVHLLPLSAWLPGSVRRLDGRVAFTAAVEGGSGLPLTTRGTLEITQPLLIVPERFLPGVSVRTGRVEVQPDHLAIHDLHLATFGGEATLAAELALPKDDAPASARWSLDGHARLDELARFFAPFVSDASGTAHFALAASGPPLAPRLSGHVDLLGASTLFAALPTRLLASDARLTLTPRGAELRGLRITAGDGRIEVGPDALSFTLLGLRPLRFSVEAPIAATDIAATFPKARLALDDLDLHGQVTAARNAAGPLTVGGHVQLDRAALRLLPRQSAAAPRGPAPPRPSTPRPPRPSQGPALDLRVVAPPGGVTLALPWIPDPSLGLDCRFEGPLGRPSSTGHVEGSDWLTQFGLWIYDVLLGHHLRSCQVPN